MQRSTKPALPHSATQQRLLHPRMTLVAGLPPLVMPDRGVHAYPTYMKVSQLLWCSLGACVMLALVALTARLVLAAMSLFGALGQQVGGVGGLGWV